MTLYRVKYIFVLAASCLFQLGIQAQSLNGDVNGDGKIDVADVTSLTNLCLHPDTSSTEVLAVVDIDPVGIHDGYVEPTATTASFSCYFEDNGKVGYGVAYSSDKNKNAIKWNRVYSHNSEWGIFGANVNHLKPSTTYYYRFFVTTDSTIYFAKIKSFETQSVSATINSIETVDCKWTDAIIGSIHDCQTDADITGISYKQSGSDWQYASSELFYDGIYTTLLHELIPDCEYELRPFIVAANDTLYGESTSMHTKGFGEEPMDLGLSVKWASKNLGAEKPEDSGMFYKWGETFGQEKSNPITGGWSSYSLCEGTAYSMKKYCLLASRGSIDGLTVLLPEDDAATVALGSEWRMPTDDEFTELRTKCLWTWTTLHGIKGYVVANNDNAIFMPVTGNIGSGGWGLGHGGFYWSSSMLDNSYQAWRIQFYDSRITRFRDQRFYGECIRPVYTK